MLAFTTSQPLFLIGSTETNAKCSHRPLVTMGPWKKGEKDEAFLQQQEILARRRDKKRNKQYFDDIHKRRAEVEEDFQNRQLKVKEGEDPLIPWKEMKDKGYIDEGGYSEEDEGGIPIPMASFGIPYYDRGGRFDLKLPHVEHGYEDPDADIMAKAGKKLKNLFGFGGKKEPTQDEKETSEKDN